MRFSASADSGFIFTKSSTRRVSVAVKYHKRGRGARGIFEGVGNWGASSRASGARQNPARGSGIIAPSG